MMPWIKRFPTKLLRPKEALGATEVELTPKDLRDIAATLRITPVRIF